MSPLGVHGFQTKSERRNKLGKGMKLMFTKILVLSLTLGCGGQESKPKEAPKTGEQAAAAADSQEDAGIAAIDEFIAKSEIDLEANPTQRNRMPMPPKVKFAENKNYYWHMQTNVGELKIKLFADVAPMHVSSTIYLVRTGFYDGLGFHRIISKPSPFMAQGGCPNGNGRGSPGYKYAGEFSPKLRHDRPGLLSMANAGPNTDGSQFFLTFVPTPHLDDKHTIFGEIVGGKDTLKTLQDLGGGMDGRPSKPVKMEKNWITVEDA